MKKKMLRLRSLGEITQAPLKCCQTGKIILIKAASSSLVGIATLFLPGKYQNVGNYQGGFINAALIKT